MQAEIMAVLAVSARTHFQLGLLLHQLALQVVTQVVAVAVRLMTAVHKVQVEQVVLAVAVLVDKEQVARQELLERQIQVAVVAVRQTYLELEVAVMVVQV
jgi:hypothetical protein